MINRKRCRAFWERAQTDRPLLAGWVGSYQAAELYPHGLARLPDGQLRPQDIDFESFRLDYEALYENHRRFDADVPWAAFPVMVLPWVEAIIGCPIRHHDGNIWAEPCIDDFDDWARQGLQINAGWLERLVEFTRWLVRLSDGRFPVALSLMRGPADLLAAARGAERSIYDLYDYPEDTRQALKVFTHVWTQVAHAQLAHLPPFAGGHAFSVQSLWGERPGGWFQDDAIAFWSPKFYRQHVLACEARLSRSMELTGIHLHPASLFTVDDLVQMPDLDVIEVNLDDVGPRIPEMIPRFQQILAHKRLLVWGALTGDDLALMQRTLPTGGLCLQLIGPTPEYVQEMIDTAKAIWSTGR